MLMMGDQAKPDVSPRLSTRRRCIVFDSNVDGAADSTNIATSDPKRQEDNTDVAATDADGGDEEAVDSVNATAAVLRKLGDENFSGHNREATPQHKTTKTKRRSTPLPPH
jgi:hypothetical protein